MAQIIGLPKLSPTMEEGVLVRWVKKEGDSVSPGDLVAEVETDKANMDFNIEDDGTLLKLLVKEGDTVKLGAPVAILGNPGEDVTALVAEAAGGGNGAGSVQKAAPAEAKPAEKAAPAAKAEPAAKAAPAKAAPAPAKAAPAKAAPAKAAAPAKPGSLLASPLAKSLAIELGIDLRTVTGSGPGGRIVERDVRDAASGDAAPAQAEPETETPDAEEAEVAPAAKAKPAAKADSTPSTAIAVRGKAPVATSDADFEDVPASNMRKRIAARLTEAKRDVPHFYLMRQVDAGPLLAFREKLNALLGADRPDARGKVSVNDLIVKAVALALVRVPECNAAWHDDSIRRFHRVHVGVAVAIEDGLVTPVVFDADKKGIGAIASEVRDLATRAKSRQLKGHEITGSTFTVSNLGMFGIERFTAILNPPEAGILAIGGVMDVPVVKDGQVVVGKRLTVTMSCDHRVIDGALGARWLVQLADLIEHPESLAL
jgi:pyruvate dehydrogenase E2 component (dihydrolipoamide acetyltransferase)